MITAIYYRDMSSPFLLPEIVGFVIDIVHMVPDLSFDLYLAAILPIEHLGKWAYLDFRSAGTSAFSIVKT